MNMARKIGRSSFWKYSHIYLAAAEAAAGRILWHLVIGLAWLWLVCVVCALDNEMCRLLSHSSQCMGLCESNRLYEVSCTSFAHRTLMHR